MKRNIQILSCICFCGFIGFLSIANIIQPNKQFSENENRYLAKVPTFSLKTLFNDNYTGKLETYFTDQFIFRDQWISVKSLSKKLTGSIENNGVYFGKNNQLLQMFATTDMETVNNSINYINQFIHKVDVPVDMMIIPTASEIESSALPVFAYNENQEAILQMIESKIDANWIDIYSVLSGTDQVFFNLDHHWNEKGAYLAYLAYLNFLGVEPTEFTYEKVTDDFKGTLYSKAGTFWLQGEPLYKINPVNQVKSTITFEDGTSMNSLYSDKYLSQKDKYSYYLDGNHALVKIKNEGVQDSLGTLLVVKDSYSHILTPYLASHFDEIILVDLRYYRLPISKLIQEEEVTNVLLVYNIENFLLDKNFSFLK
ncbi:DHHW family protein [Anaerorhabdus furcosa]|uniref:DHHW protein n=1 Tax=Anaerorhabdus furcosa TaxID=118967 RepID=A0A1T4LK73_9FIRM|nr:DHHW family protein [Anaerorhabdus furcosa]SJZ55129.1 DHHW protein [Anaerorhabdus furcosa]